MKDLSKIIQAETNPGKKHLRPELRRETSALWKVPHNRAYMKIINEHLNIIHINEIRHSHRLCTIKTEHISKPLAPRSKIFKQNFFFQANYLSLQVTKKTRTREMRRKHQEEQHTISTS